MPDQSLYSVGCLVRKENQVLLVRHTYGGAAGKLLIPGGFCNQNELPEEAAEREVLEETGVTAKAGRLLGLRCHRSNWYLLLELTYITGTPASDGNENSEALFCDIHEALSREDCTDMTKYLLRKVLASPENCLDWSRDYRAQRGEDYALYL